MPEGSGREEGFDLSRKERVEERAKGGPGHEQCRLFKSRAAGGKSERMKGRTNDGKEEKKGRYQGR